MLNRLIQHFLLLCPFIIGSWSIDFLYKGSDDTKKIGDAYIYVLICGIVGARLTYALFHMESYADNFGRILHISGYNFSFIGGVLFSIIALFLWSRGKKINLFHSYFSIFYIVFIFKYLMKILSNIMFPNVYSIVSKECAFVLMVVYFFAFVIDRRIEEKYSVKHRGVVFIIIVILDVIVKNIF